MLAILFVGGGVSFSSDSYGIYLSHAKTNPFGSSDPDDPGTEKGHRCLLESLKERRVF